MPVIQVRDKQHILQPGQTRLGGGAGVDVAISGDDNLGIVAIIDLAGGNQAVIRRAREGAAVKVNGVALAEPTPLMHGDKVEVSGTEILFSEDKKIGATHFVSAAEVSAAAAKRAGPAKATANTGGRVVSLVDGKEYQIPSAGITFGREAGSDIVVAQPEVSRRHATITPTQNGYFLQDLSTNGVWVNGTRVQGSVLLSRADVVKVGSEEFRFYADVASASAPASAKPTPVASSMAVPSQSQPPASSSVSPPAAPASPTAPAPASQPQPPAPPPSTPAHSVSAVPSLAPTSRVPHLPPAASQPQPPQSTSQPPAEPTARVPQIPPAEPTARVPQVKAADPAPRGEPKSSPRPGAPAASARPKKEASTARKEDRHSTVPTWIWLVILVIVAAAAYYVGQGGRG